MIKTVLVGTGGFAKHHLREYLKRAEEGKVQIVGVVDPKRPEDDVVQLLQKKWARALFYARGFLQ